MHVWLGVLTVLTLAFAFGVVFYLAWVREDIRKQEEQIEELEGKFDLLVDTYTEIQETLGQFNETFSELCEATAEAVEAHSIALHKLAGRPSDENVN
jgi:molybdopterin converting factor small subunit